MAENVFPIDQSKSMAEQDKTGHNRWHSYIPAVASLDPGTDFLKDCRQRTDGQIKNTEDASDVRDIDLTRLHASSGPTPASRAGCSSATSTRMARRGKLPAAAAAATATNPAKELPLPA